METPDDDRLDRIAGLRLEDILKFRQIYEKLKNSPPEQRRNFKALFTGLGYHTTTIGQLERVISFLFDPSPNRGPRFDLLFSRSSESAGLEPTDASHELYKRSRILVDAYRSMRDAVQPSRQLPAVRIGAAGTIGFWLLSSIFSDWHSQFGSRMRLDVELGASRDLVMRLHAGFFDFVVAYGSANEQGMPEPALNVCFDSLDYSTRMVLIAHPAENIRLKDGTDINAKYWENDYACATPKPSKTKAIAADTDAQRRPSYEELRQLDLAQVNFATTRFIVVPSWRQPEALKRFTEELGQHVEIRNVPYYDESLSLVRMGLGIAPVPEIFLRRRRITAFRLSPEEAYTRWIGIFRNTARPISPQACCLIHFLRHYMDGPKFKDSISAGPPMGFGHPAFAKHCSRFNVHQDWATIAAKEYPPT